MKDIVLLLQLSLALLSNPHLTPAQKEFVNHAAQIAQEALAQAAAPTSTAQPATQYVAPPALQYNGESYAPTPANQDILNKIHQTENSCIEQRAAIEKQIAASNVPFSNNPFLNDYLAKLKTNEQAGENFCESTINSFEAQLTK